MRIKDCIIIFGLLAIMVLVSGCTSSLTGKAVMIDDICKGSKYGSDVTIKGTVANIINGGSVVGCPHRTDYIIELDDGSLNSAYFCMDKKPSFKEGNMLLVKGIIESRGCPFHELDIEATSIQII